MSCFSLRSSKCPPNGDCPLCSFSALDGRGNKAFIEALPELAKRPFKTVYASGEIYYDDYKAIFEQYKTAANLDIRPYINNMTDL